MTKKHTKTLMYVGIGVGVGLVAGYLITTYYKPSTLTATMSTQTIPIKQWDSHSYMRDYSYRTHGFGVYTKAMPLSASDDIICA